MNRHTRRRNCLTFLVRTHDPQHGQSVQIYNVTPPTLDWAKWFDLSQVCSCSNTTSLTPCLSHSDLSRHSSSFQTRTHKCRCLESASRPHQALAQNAKSQPASMQNEKPSNWGKRMNLLHVVPGRSLHVAFQSPRVPLKIETHGLLDTPATYMAKRGGTTGLKRNSRSSHDAMTGWI